MRTNHLDATRERHVIPLNSEEGAIFLKVILPMAYSKLYRESGPNKMAPLALILLEREHRLRDPVFFLDQCAQDDCFMTSSFHRHTVIAWAFKIVQIFSVNRDQHF